MAFLLCAVGVQTMEGIATAGAVLLMVCGLAARRWSRAALLADLRAWWPLIAFLLWALVVPWAAGHRPQGAGLGRLSDWLALPAAALLFSLLTPGRRATLAWTVAIVFLVSCVCCFLQHYSIWPHAESLRWLHWTRIPFDRVQEEIVGSPGRYYGGGLAFHRLKFGNVGGVVVVGAFVAALRTRGVARIAAVTTVGLGIAAMMVAAQARAASLALLMTLVLMTLSLGLDWRRLLAVFVLLIVVVSGVLVLAPGARHRFLLVTNHESNGDRSVIWNVAMRAVRSSPITGVGLGQYRASKFAEAGTIPWPIYDHPGKAHNQILSFAAEIGIPGATLFVVLCLWLLFRCRNEGQLLGRGLVTFFLLLCCVHDPLFHATVSIAFVVAFGVALAMSREPAAVNP